MRREQKHPKAKQVVPMPDDLATFLREVHALIEADDDAATIESDDLLQCEIAYGGLIETGYRQVTISDTGKMHDLIAEWS